MKKYTKYLLPIIIAFIFSCDNEPSDISTLSAEDAITVNSELYNNIERVADENLENNETQEVVYTSIELTAIDCED